ncbi:hypothetical protein DFH09DRAFT_629604 [Mycena vulgaris]|nr:hypothetical protein DFH09DRAFT_629604 [Mycena vulgaris]
MTGVFDLGEMQNLLQESAGLHRRPILDSLSDEVLSRIFGYLRASSVSIPPEFIIASITQRWREVAIGIPSLWTTVRVSHDRQIHALGDILLRSKNLPLRICIRLDAFRYRFCAEYTDAIDLLLPHIARWQSLSIIATNPVLHTIRNRIQRVPMPALEHLELVQTGTGPIHHLGPLVFEPSVFRSLRLERTMIYAADATLLAGITELELIESSMSILDEKKLLSTEYPTQKPRPPSMTALRRLVLDATNPTSDGLPYSPAFSPAHLTSVSLVRLAASSIGIVKALAHVFGTALSPPALRNLSIADIHGNALIMLLAVIRATQFPALRSLSLADIDTAGIDAAFIAAFTGGVEQLVLARLDAEPVLTHLADPAVWPTLQSITLDGVEVPRPRR